MFRSARLLDILKASCRPWRLVTPEVWERSKFLQALMMWALVLSSFKAYGEWYVWLDAARGAVLAPLLWTILPVVVVAAAPKKLDLITLSVGAFFCLAVIGTLLRKGPLSVGIALMALTGVPWLLLVLYNEYKRR